MSTKTKRQQIREKQNRRDSISKLFLGGIAVGFVAILGVMLWQVLKPAAGEKIPEMAVSHIELDTDPGEYNSDPPTSGPHYAQEAEAGFYETNIYTYPAGYLMHNLEHGYVIFWYNCKLLDETGCSELKSQIRSVMDEIGGVKVIAYPWESIDVPLVMTSWKRLQKFETFNANAVKAFYHTNLNRAPEPRAP